MALPLDEAVSRLKNVEGYRNLFDRVFSDGVTATNIGKAISTFERTVISGDSPFDRWIEGDEAAISESAKKGFVLFNDKAKCADCHSGWNFTDNRFHDIGLNTKDEGRYRLDPSTDSNRFAFKTPSLRNIAQRAPYMHNGSVDTLEGVIIHYITGGIKRPSLSEKMQPVQLNKDEVQQ